jgi:hypothetical protein
VLDLDQFPRPHGVDPIIPQPLLDLRRFAGVDGFELPVQRGFHVDPSGRRQGRIAIIGRSAVKIESSR